MRTLTRAQAQRTAIYAQGLAGGPAQARPGAKANAGHLQRMLDKTALLQIDSVNVVARAHLLPVFARLGDHPPALLPGAIGKAPRRLVECVAHEASLVVPQVYHWLRWRMRSQRRLAHAEKLRREHPKAYEAVMAMISDRGPMTAAQIHAELGHDRAPKDHWGWNWTTAKQIMESQFAIGELASAHRTQQFERAYDLTSRVLPGAGDPAPDPTESIRGLIDLAARAHGIGSIRCLADYFRLPIADTSDAVAHLVAAGTLEQVSVKGWDTPCYLHTSAHNPRKVNARALLAPFDPLVFERRRLLNLFSMHYRIEIYTPAAKRTYGYYVLPFVLGQDIVARVDLKADRATGALLVRSAFSQPCAGANVPGELLAELEQMATWLGLGNVAITDDAAGDLVPRLRLAQ